MASTYVPTRLEILIAKAQQTVLHRQGKHVPADIASIAAWDLDDALDTLRQPLLDAFEDRV